MIRIPDSIALPEKYREATRFLLAGALATALQYLLLVALVELSLLAPVTASLTSYGIAALANYLLNYYLTFSCQAAHRIALGRFVAVAAVGLGANGMIMHLGTHLLQWHYLPVQLAATVVVLLWNYLAHSVWTYRSSPRRPI